VIQVTIDEDGAASPRVRAPGPAPVPAAAPSKLKFAKLDKSHKSPITQVIFSNVTSSISMISLSKDGTLQGRVWGGEIKFGTTPFRIDLAQPQETARELKPRQLAITSSNSYLLVATRQAVQLYDPTTDKGAFMTRKTTQNNVPMQLPASPSGITDSLASISLHSSDNNSPVYGFKGGRICIYIKKLPNKYFQLEQSTQYHKRTVRRVILWSADLSAGTGRLISASRDGCVSAIFFIYFFLLFCVHEGV
jgi:hypothetical protein